MKAFSALPVSPPSGTSRKMTLILLMALVLMTGTACFGSPPKVPEPFDITLEPLGDLVKGGPITMSLTYKLNLEYDHYAGDTGSYTVMFLDPRNHKDTLSRTTYPVSYDNTYSYSTTFQTVLPDADTNYCVVQVSCGTINYCARTYFIAEGDKVEFLRYFKMPFPMDLYPKGVMIAHAVKGGPPHSSRRFNRPGSGSDDQYRDSSREMLTSEQLQTEYEVMLKLHDPEKFKIAKDILGGIPDSCLYDRKNGYYKVKATLENILDITDQGIGGNFVEPPPWETEHWTPDGIQPEEESEPDSASMQGRLPIKMSPSVNGISLDHVDGLASEGVLPTGRPITFFLRLKNPLPFKMQGITNGFRVSATRSPIGRRC